MRTEDVEAIRALLRRNQWLRGRDVVAPSGESMERELFESEWGVGIMTVPQSEWDLYDRPQAHIRGGLLLVCNTMLCSRDPLLWLKNLADAADYAIIQDLSTAPRSQGRITDPGSGDHMRYSVSTHGVVGRVDQGDPFDLGTCGAPVMDCERYFDGAKFVVLMDLRPLRRNASGVVTAGWFGMTAAWLSETLSPLVEYLPALA